MSGERLVALDAKTGNPIGEFGEGGKVNLRSGLPLLEEYQWNAPPLVCRDTVIVVIYVNDVPLNKEQAPGYIRGFRRRHRPAEVAIQPGAAAGRAGQRDLGGRLLGVHPAPRRSGR